MDTSSFMAEQLPLELSCSVVLPVDKISNEAFTLANADVMAWVERWPEQMPGSHVMHSVFSHALFLYGPSGCGKTHLAMAWQRRTRATVLNALIAELEAHDFASLIQPGGFYIIENVDQSIDEKCLFHLFNLVHEMKAYVLLTSTRAPVDMALSLPDIRSRLNAIPVIGIEPPNDEVLHEALLAAFSKRQLRVGEDVLEYLLLRIERSFAAVEAVVDYIDRSALQAGRAITVPFIRQIWQQQEGEIEVLQQHCLAA